ncbi:MAG TPA: cellobiose phosphorylase, partial [Candidatus Omnitrophota bacterium]|nr:cellobiose phosphorylase [Candidatus Omnitrophota bacterium]
MYSYLSDKISFSSPWAYGLRTVYFPLCGVDARSLKSSITPRLSGDMKTDQDHYVTRPVSVEDLRQDLRNFFCYVKGQGIISLAGAGETDAVVEAGMLWHKLTCVYPQAGIRMEALNFVPVSGENAELMRITVRNISDEQRVITPTFSLPLFARALSNKHDHEHVTSLLHRIELLPNGLCVEPTMIFNERGHRPGDALYYVMGADAHGAVPVGMFPTAESFYGEGGTAAAPDAVVRNLAPSHLSTEDLQGKEAVGALRFADETLAPGEARDYLIVAGMAAGRQEMAAAFNHFNSVKKFDAALEKNKMYWAQKTEAICFSTGDPSFDSWMRWVALQPVLRRIYGCSFLPDHDYGKGGRGWRDIWQDLLSLILIEPEPIRKTLIDNFAGVRIDGSNATIIGAQPGEFIADRNAITRVWMDHGVWPLVTVLLYIEQTGDYDILLEPSAYFRDGQMSRTFKKDPDWTPADGNALKDKTGKAYRGTLIEHILVQHAVQFFNVGEHNVIRLEDADWNDGLDMARERGESVAFAAFYGGNLLALADLLEKLASAKKLVNLRLADEVCALLDSLGGAPVNYDNPKAKKKHLFDAYFPSVQPAISGRQSMVAIKDIVADLRRKGQWLFDHIRKNEIVAAEHDGRKNRWFNGHYDNTGERVERKKGDRARITLAGQVFPIMSGLAGTAEIEDVIQSVETYLKDKDLGGIRVNSDFGLRHYLDLGRAFGFAYGTKENGAFFSHMTVMYAYALYERGFARKGYEAIRSIYRMAADTKRSKIYPGIPEYFDSTGRGRYHYLTGSASWLILTRLKQAFGIRGDGGDLVLAPQLVREEFDPATGRAVAACRFAGKEMTVTYENPGRLDVGSYKIKEAFLNGKPFAFGPDETP